MSKNQTANDNKTEGASDDQLQPFQIESSTFRGRIVRLNNVLNEILDAHKYPPAVSRIMAEAMALTSLLAGMLKFEGIFTLQIKGDKSIRSMVCDMTSKGEIRAYSSFDKDLIAKLGDKPTIAEIFGEGYLAFTVDQAENTERYQGIVELKDGETLVNSINHYFSQSEQIATSIRVAADKIGERWIAGAVMLQKLPEDTRIQVVDKDDWNREKIMLQSCKDEELLNVDLPIHDLLYRLFHEQGVTVFPTQNIRKGCRCTQERVENILLSLSDDEISDMTINGKIEMTCEFCNREYSFNQKQLKALVESRR